MRRPSRGVLQPSGGCGLGLSASRRPLPAFMEGNDMQGDAAREAQTFTLVAGCLMVGLILFGVLELLNVVHV
jgi:hypothetical protein